MCHKAGLSFSFLQHQRRGREYLSTHTNYYYYFPALSRQLLRNRRVALKELDRIRGAGGVNIEPKYGHERQHSIHIA